MDAKREKVCPHKDGEMQKLLKISAAIEDVPMDEKRRS